MSHKIGADRARRTRILLSLGAQSMWRRLARHWWAFGVFAPRFPTRLLIAPPDIRTADPTVAADIYAGYFVFDGKAVNTHGRSPFSVEAPSTAWAESLASFSWLRHLRAAETSLARVNARALVGDWIGQSGKPRDVPDWSPDTVSRRVLAWLSQSPIILEGADGSFYRTFMQSLARHASFLRRATSMGLSGESRLLAAIALAELGLCAEGGAKLRRQATRILLDELAAQVLADGGHVSRDPAVPANLLLYVLPLRQAFVAAGVAVPQPLMSAIDRMMPMVRTFRHGDGALALFNGMGVTRPEALATVLAYDDVRGRPLANALHSGYQRLEAGAAVVILDAGPPPPVGFSRRAHAGTLAFEFSVGLQQIIVNCGAPDAGSREVREAARATAAHSTLVVADRSSSRFVSGPRKEGLIYVGPVRVPVKRSQDDAVIEVMASHDGYLSRFGIVHRRRLGLAPSGDRLEGEDVLLTAPATRRTGADRRAREPRAFALRFHLHPSLRVRPIRDDSAALIGLPNGELWMFEAGGLLIRIEESIYFAGADGARRTDQIVVLGDGREPASILWSLSRSDGADEAQGRASPAGDAKPDITTGAAPGMIGGVGRGEGGSGGGGATAGGSH